VLRRFRSRGDCAGEVQVQRYRNSDVLQMHVQVQVQMQSCRGGAEVVQRYRYGGVLRNLGSAEV